MNEHRLAIVVQNTAREAQRKIENNVIWDLRELDEEDGKRPTERTLKTMRAHAMDAVECLKAIDELMNVMVSLEHVKNEKRKMSRKVDKLEDELKAEKVRTEQLLADIQKMTASDIALDA